MNRVAVCVATRDEVATPFAFDLANAVARHLMDTEDAVVPIHCSGTILAAQRCNLVLEAKRENATHLMFVDSDMRFPADTIARLLKHGKPVVAANCARRRMPTGPTACNYSRENGGKEAVYSMPEDTGLARVDSVGTGLMLIDMDIFDHIPAPWFATPWVIDRNGFMGEDVFFCRAVGAKGIPVFIDHDLSKEIGHIGTFEYRHEHTWAVRDAEEARRLNAAN